ncbi:hypothetical protein [Bradyrhizobium sp. 144]|uniref:hypothetical protein n=1 Tax=Bradyrhizobium sp. 144 TaxID=2782620 RepID=UPI001FF87F6D|nr:hypothetical protein [Bradyrhizobium sp. 144]MCK1693837.1 hypothetical protein [Bradyrhizobium sp. 144]
MRGLLGSQAALALVLSATSVFAQEAGTVSNHAIPIGKGPGVTGYASLPPGSSGLPVVSNGASSNPSYQALGAAGLATNSVTNAKINPGSANTFKGSLDGSTTSDIALTACSAVYQLSKWVSGTGWQCGINFITPSRATAATLDLSAHSVIRTLGYTAAGDGGGATFKKTSAGAPFKDTFVSSASVTSGGSGYINGTYLGVPLTGGSGQGCAGQVTVAGGVVTSIVTAAPCTNYTAGNILTPFNGFMGGSGSGAQYTVSAVSSPLGSFTDAAGNLWQIVTDANAFPNVRQFGCKLDWDGSDAAATNDRACFQSAIAFAYNPTSSASALVNGTSVTVPKGAAYLCGDSNNTTLLVPQGVALLGAGMQGGSSLKQCTASNSTAHFVTLCDPLAQFGQFGCKLENISLLADGTANANIAAVYSNSGQQFALLKNVYIQPGTRGCIYYEIGKGGASNAIFDGVDCEVSDAITNSGVVADSSGTQIVLRDFVFGCAPSNCALSAYAINLKQGNMVLENFHIEQHRDAILIGTTSTAHLSSIRNGTIVQGCVNGITLLSTNPNNTVLVENIESSCSTATVLNGHSGGSNVTGHVLAQRVFNP